MILLIFNIIGFIFPLFFKSQKNLIAIILTLKQNNEILSRTIKNNNLTIHFTNQDRFSFSLLSFLSEKVREFINLVKPETLLKWYRQIIKNRWNFSSKSKRKRGKPQTKAWIKNLILEMKNNSPLMRTEKIQGELLKLEIELSQSTIRRIIAEFRKKGKIQSTVTWRKFIKAHIESLYAMDFFTVDSILGRRFYVFFIMYLKTREIIRFSVTDIPSKLFVRNQLIEFMYDREDKKTYLIHDGSGEFRYQDYKSLGITNILISPYAPNMNAHAERFIGSVRRECLDWFIIFTYGQLCRILKEYITYYNTMRPHQGINQSIPQGYTSQDKGRIVKMPVLSGLWHHYYREAA